MKTDQITWKMIFLHDYWLVRCMITQGDMRSFWLKSLSFFVMAKEQALNIGDLAQIFLQIQGKYEVLNNASWWEVYKGSHTLIIYRCFYSLSRAQLDWNSLNQWLVPLRDMQLQEEWSWHWCVISELLQKMQSWECSTEDLVIKSINR